jgi:hypothetical protein
MYVGVTDFDSGDNDVRWHYGDHPGTGGEITFEGGGGRVYSIVATVAYNSTSVDSGVTQGSVVTKSAFLVSKQVGHDNKESDCCYCNTVVRTLIQGAHVEASGGEIRIKFGSNEVADYVIRNVVIGERKDVYDMVPTSVTTICFEGNSGACTGKDNDITVPSLGSGLWSQWFKFDIKKDTGVV